MHHSGRVECAEVCDVLVFDWRGMNKLSTSISFAFGFLGTCDFQAANHLCDAVSCFCTVLLQLIDEGREVGRRGTCYKGPPLRC